jgi:hypothetical protein
VRRVSALLACLAVGLGIVLPARGQGTFKLEYKPLGGERDPLARVTRRLIGRQTARPPKLKGLPDGLGENLVFFNDPVGELMLLAVVEPADVPRMYVDTDLDGDLADEQPAVIPGQRPGTTMRGTIWFEPLLIGAEGGEHPRVQTSIAPYVFGGKADFMFMLRSGAHFGRVKLGQKEYAVVLVDGTFDGRLDDPFGSCEPGRLYSRHDFFAIDLNGDGEFDIRKEIMPLPAMVRVEGVCYALSVEPDGSSVTLRPTTPKMGTLEPASDAVAAMVWSTAGMLELAEGKGPWEVPVGKYEVAGFWLRAHDDDGNRWEVTGAVGEQRETFEIRDGETTPLRCGPPLVVKAEVGKEEGGVSINAVLVGQAGERYSPAVQENGKRLPAPKFRVLDEKGSELASGSLQYG